MYSTIVSPPDIMLKNYKKIQIHVASRYYLLNKHFKIPGEFCYIVLCLVFILVLRFYLFFKLLSNLSSVPPSYSVSF